LNYDDLVECNSQATNESTQRAARLFAIAVSTFSFAASGDALIWEPASLLSFATAVPSGTLARDPVSGFRIADFPVVLEKTTVADAQRRFGGTVGRHGDASEYLEWLCLENADARNRWVLWLMNAEINGGTIGGFQWKRISQNATVDGRCGKLPRTISAPELPKGLQLGMTAVAVKGVFGKPTVTHGNKLLYVHESRGQSYKEINTVTFLIEHDIVLAMEVWKTTDS
jgi:hypothetical protein